MLEPVRQPLLEEARRSPTLLSDLAGLEHYVAESYDARSFIELLQNADDAGASRFTIQRSGELLFVANDGRRFTNTDFESLCRSAASAKHRGESIGYRGIGFKSVVGIAQTIHLFSGRLETTFSRERTAEEIPEATRVPLVRIPHPVKSADRKQLAGVIENITGDGFNTVFVFGDLIASGIEAEFTAFDPTSLLFLRNIRQVELQTGVEAIITVRRETVDARTRSIRLTSSNGVALWTVLERDEVALAFIHGDKGITRLEEQQAVVHAFLPTQEPAGIAGKINGDVSTDPSRTRVILDERTAARIEVAAKFVIELIEESLGSASPSESKHLLAALLPISDPRTASFQRRSFKTELFAALQRTVQGKFQGLRLRPPWLNPVDFKKLAKASGIRAVPREFEDIEGLSDFLRFLGSRQATVQDLSAGLTGDAPSLAGAAEVVAHLVALHGTKQIQSKSVNAKWNLWPVGNIPVPLEEAKRAKKPLDRGFCDLVAEKTGVSSQLHRLVSELTNAAVASALIVHSPPSASAQEGPELPATPTVQRLSLKRWRSAEQQVLELLTAQGWEVVDVSRQNVGYDLEARSPNGEEACVEVKAIDSVGQPFVLTSNEEAVARQKGGAYQIALVRQTSAHLEVAFIRDPSNTLELTRQCRQWVWECSSYDFNPERFALE